MISALCMSLAVFLAVPASPHARCRRVFSSGTPARNLSPSPAVTAMAIAVVGSLLLFGAPMGILVGAVAAPLAGRSVGRLESASTRRRRALIGRQLPGAVDLLIAVLDAGRPPVDAFDLVAGATSEPLGSELALIANRLSVAGDEQAVWEGLKPEFASLGRSFRRAGRSGMPVGKVLLRLADELRREQRASGQERARSVAVATAAPLGACFLPAFFLIGILPTIFGTFRSLPL